MWVLWIYNVLIVSAYVANPDKCAACHEKQHQFWEKTHHASAYLVLYAKNAHFDPDCVRCHTLGYREKSGFSDIAAPIQVKGVNHSRPDKAWIECFLDRVFGMDNKEPLDSRKDPKRYQRLKTAYHKERKNLKAIKKDFMNVQCEHCHGDREAHLNTGKRLSVKISEKTCTQCHTRERDPQFTMAKLTLVACPKIK